MKPTLLLATLGLAAAIFAPLSAATLTFGTAGDYDNNFWEPTGSAPGTLVWNNSGYLAKTSATSASTAIYNSHATGGTAGSGGTAGGTPLDKFSNFTVKADASFNEGFGSGSASLGFYTKVNDAATSGYLAVFRIESTSKATLRLFEAGNPSTASGAGTQIGTSVDLVSSGSNFVLGTFYTFSLTVQDIGGNVSFTGSVLTAGGTLIGSAQTLSDTTSAVTGLGQVGIRLGASSASSLTRMDNFSITAIPEPSTYALLGGVGALGLALVTRRKRA